MLSSMRGALKGVTSWFIIVLLILAFALWGVPELTNIGRGAAVRVGDQGISTQTVLNEFNRSMVNQRIQSDGAFTREDAIATGLPNQVVETLAGRSLVQQEAENLGLAMPRSLVREFLSNDERFQNPSTGKFDNDVLQQLLSTYQMSVRGFEREMRETFLRQQLLSSLDGGGYIAGSFSDALLLRQLEQRTVSYLTMTEEMSGIPEEPTPDKLRTFYEENPQSFTAPEYRTFRVVKLRGSDFEEDLEVDEEELRRIYDIQKSRLYERPEQRTLYQVTYDTEAEAQAAVAALRQGKAIEEIASERQLNLDAVTFTDITKDRILDQSVAEAAFSADLSTGDTSDPVQSFSGWTIVQVATITAPETQSFEDVRDEIKDAFLAQDTRQQLYDAIDEIENARDAGSDIAAAAEGINLDVSTFGPIDSFSFAPGGAIIGGIEGEILEEAFTLAEGEESEAIEFADKDGWFFITIDEITPPALTPFETAEPEVLSRWQADERNRRISRAVQQVSDALSAGATLAEAAVPFNAEPVVEKINRRAAGPVFSERFLSEVFSINKGEAATGSAPTGNDQTIVVVDEIEFERVAIGPGQETAFKQYLGLQLDQELAQAYLDALRDDYNVRIDQQQIDVLFAQQQ